MKKLKKKYFSLHKLPKQQSTSFWSQGILGVKNLWKKYPTQKSFKIKSFLATQAARTSK
jgi:hypothetical protein